MAVDDTKGPMRGPRSTEEVEKSAAAVVRGAGKPAAGSQDPPAAAPTDDATEPVISDQEDA